LQSPRIWLSSSGTPSAIQWSSAEIIDKMAFLQRMPDLIVSVYRLRNGESGIRLVETVREEFSADIPALIVIGDNGPERIRQAQASGLYILLQPAESIPAAGPHRQPAAEQISRGTTRSGARPTRPESR